jgi:hypothetical protein
MSGGRGAAGVEAETLAATVVALRARIAELEALRASDADYAAELERERDALRAAGDKLAEFVSLTRKEGAELPLASDILAEWRGVRGG